MDDNKPVLLTLHEALRLDLIEAYMAREITLAEVAESMELTRRQCSRLIKRYRELGPAGLVSRRRGKPGNHQLNTTIRDQALQLVTSSLFNTNIIMSLFSHLEMSLFAA
ncbi:MULTISPECIES: helix-turn-helix domain-containing protein [Serratia]|nr:helix-turn-helix domain-containing protein [Serratia marcescens]